MELVEDMEVLSPQARFTAAVTEYGRAMFRAARAVLDTDADAEDAVGEAVLRAWRSYGRLRDPGALRAWLLKITVNCAYEQRRKHGREISLEGVEEPSGCDEAATDLWDVVSRLDVDYRVVVTLFYYEDMTIGEIAKTLKVPQGTVKSRLSRARMRLRDMLAE